MSKPTSEPTPRRLLRKRARAQAAAQDKIWRTVRAGFEEACAFEMKFNPKMGEEVTAFANNLFKQWEGEARRMTFLVVGLVEMAHELIAHARAKREEFIAEQKKRQEKHAEEFKKVLEMKGAGRSGTVSA